MAPNLALDSDERPPQHHQPARSEPDPAPCLLLWGLRHRQMSCRTRGLAREHSRNNTRAEARKARPRMRYLTGLLTHTSSLAHLCRRSLSLSETDAL